MSTFTIHHLVPPPTITCFFSSGPQVRNGESNLGDLQCEAMLQFVATQTGLLEQNPGMPPVCLVNGGGIR